MGQSEDFELVALVDRVPERCELLIKEKGLKDVTAYEDLTRCLVDMSFDALAIFTPDGTHGALVIPALQANKYVFVEKPLCRSLEELRAIRQAWLACPGRHLMSNLVLRAAPLYRWLHTAIRAGEFGEVYAFDGEYLYGRVRKITRGWRNTVPDYSVMQGGGVHLVDLMIGLTGRRPIGVTAVGNRVCTAGTAFKYDDYRAATFSFESGLIGRITANFGCVHRHHHVVRVFGTKAMVEGIRIAQFPLAKLIILLAPPMHRPSCHI